MTFFSYLLEGEDSVSFKIDGGGNIYPKWILDRNITPTLRDSIGVLETSQ